MDANKTQVGVVSFGYGGCASEYQDVYARVSSYVEWIDEQLTDGYCPAKPSSSSSNAACDFAKSIGYLANVQFQRVTNLFGRIFGG